MSEETHDVGMEEMEPDGYLQPKRYRITCRCGRCGHEYSRITTRVTEKNPPCPRKKCKEAALKERIQIEAENLAQILAEQRAPAQIGDKVVVKAIDQTAEIVMKDYGMTNLKDNIRHGENMAPKLDNPKMQAAADNFFGGDAAAKRAGISPAQMQRLGRRAIAGAYRNVAVTPAEVMGKLSGVRVNTVATDQRGR